MSFKTRLAKLEAASPASVTSQKIETWHYFIVLGNYYTMQLTDKQVEQLKPYKRMFEAGQIFSQDERYIIMDVLY